MPTATAVKNVFRVKQSALKEAIAAVMPAIPSKPSHPILACIVFDLHGKRLKSFNLSLSIDVAVPGEFEGDLGEVAIPAKRFSEIVNILPDAEIELTVEDQQLLISVEGRDIEFEIRLDDIENYPVLPMSEGVAIELSSNVLLEALQMGKFAADEDTKGVLYGINLQATDGKLYAAATNGNYLGTYQDVLPVIDSFEPVTIPVDAVSAITKLLKQDDCPDIEMSVDGGLVGFKSENFCITARILDGLYPRYQQLIPRQFSKVVTIDREPFIQQLKRAAVMTKDNDNVVIAEFSATEVRLSSRDAEVGKAKLKQSCELSGDSIRIAFNNKFLITCLEALKLEKVSISMDAPKSAVVFQSIGDERLLALLMPIQIRE